MNEGLPPERLRASDADRQRVMEVLDAALGDGRIDPTEHAERGERVAAARTLGDLVGVTTDLLPATEQPIQLRSAPIMAVGGAQRYAGRWVVPEGHVTFALFGSADIDLRDALFTRNHLRLTVSAVLGRVEIQVPDDVEVRVRGWTFLGRRWTTARQSRLASPPVLELDGFSVLGSVAVRAPRRGRSWLPWRRRDTA